MAFKTVIDENRNIVQAQVWFDENNNAYDFEMLPNYTAVDDVLNTSISITNGVEHSCLKPMWNGEKWVETATAEELEKAFPPIETPTITESERLEALEMAIAELAGEIYNG